MGAVKRTHKQARLKQRFGKFARRHPERLVEIVKDIVSELMPAVARLASYIADETIEVMRASECDDDEKAAAIEVLERAAEVFRRIGNEDEDIRAGDLDS